MIYRYAYVLTKTFIKLITPIPPISKRQFSRNSSMFMIFDILKGLLIHLLSFCSPWWCMCKVHNTYYLLADLKSNCTCEKRIYFNIFAWKLRRLKCPRLFILKTIIQRCRRKERKWRKISVRILFFKTLFQSENVYFWWIVNLFLKSNWSRSKCIFSFGRVQLLLRSI